MPPSFRPGGDRAREDQAREHERRRGSAVERGYDGKWRKASATHRERNPFCRYCEHGVFGPVRVEPATLVDHLYPQRQYPGVFWRRAYWASCCTDCHNGPKQALERQGKPALDALALRLGLEPLST